MTILVQEVRCRRAERAFFDLPRAINRNERRWIAPLASQERARWSPASNASLRCRDAVRFVAWRDRRPIGRIAAILDPAFQAAWDGEAGFFGFFDCVDDAACARALLGAAEDWLRGRGARRVIGPVNLSTHDEVGFLADGFDDPPSFLTPFNPRYYPALMEAAGYEAFREYHAYRWRPGDALPPLAQRMMRRAEQERPGLRLRAADPGRWEDEARLIRDLYNRCFGAVWGFVPIGRDEFMERATAFRHFYRPELIRIAELNGEAVGFALLLPDVNEALAKLGGRLLPFGWLRLLWGLRRIAGGRLLLLGILPEHVGQGVSVALIAQLMQIATRIGMAVEISLVDAANAQAQAIQRVFRLPRTKVFRLYRKPLAG